jgi:hypothetical protein
MGCCKVLLEMLDLGSTISEYTRHRGVIVNHWEGTQVRVMAVESF